jgi:hypothetical protein
MELKPSAKPGSYRKHAIATFSSVETAAVYYRNFRSCRGSVFDELAEHWRRRMGNAHGDYSRLAEVVRW